MLSPKLHNTKNDIYSYNIAQVFPIIIIIIIIIIIKIIIIITITITITIITIIIIIIIITYLYISRIILKALQCKVKTVKI